MSPTIESISREEAVSRLRRELIKLTDSETCICKAAAEQHLFCNGFSRYSDEELRRRYSWIVRKRPSITREELETIANDWQLAQQSVEALPIACDVQASVRDTCRGWSDFTNEQLAQFLKQVAGTEITIR